MRKQPWGTSVKAGISLEQLDALGPEARADGVWIMTGRQTAIFVGPFSTSPDEWFDDLLGEGGWLATAATDKTMAAITAIVGRFNVISEGLSDVLERHASILEKTDTVMALQALVRGLPDCHAIASRRAATAS